MFILYVFQSLSYFYFVSKRCYYGLKKFSFLCSKKDINELGILYRFESVDRNAKTAHKQDTGIYKKGMKTEFFSIFVCLPELLENSKESFLLKTNCLTGNTKLPVGNL